MNKPAKNYLETLLTYYEEEVAGESYFYGLVDHFEEQEKLKLLAKVERCAAESVVSLVEKYQLHPRSEGILLAEGSSHVEHHASMNWQGLMTYMTQRYPGYLDDFIALENMAPVEDLSALKKLTAHEVAAIEFAEMELVNDPNSMGPLYHYIQQ